MLIYCQRIKQKSENEEMLTEQQRAERRLGIGGSDVPIIFGLSKYKTPYQLFLEKIGVYSDSGEMTQQQYWGTILEPVILQEYSRRNAIDVETVNTVVHPLYPFMRANLDGFVAEKNMVIEVKCANGFMAKEWGEPGSDKIPLPYLLQVAHYCACTNADGACIVVLIGGSDYREFYYKRDMELELKVIKECLKFWEGVENKIEPELVDISDLKLKYPEAVPLKKIKATPNDLEKYILLMELSSEIKTKTATQENYKKDIMKTMGDAEVLELESGEQIATWKNTKRGSRQFLIKGGKDE